MDQQAFYEAFSWQLLLTVFDHSSVYYVALFLVK